MRRHSWPTWVMIVSAVLAIPGIVSTVYLAASQPFTPQAIIPIFVAHPLLALLDVVTAMSVVAFVIGMFAYVVVGSSSHERAEQGYGSVGTLLVCFGVAAILANVLTLPFGLSYARQHPNEPFALTPGMIVYSVVALDAMLLGIVYLRIVRPKVLTWGEMGLRASRFGDRLALGIGVGILVIIGSGLLEAVLRAVGIQQTQVDMFKDVVNAPLPQFIGVLLAGAVIAPVTEEIFFRGYVFTAACRTYGLIPAFLVSSLLFAFAHLNLQAFIPILFIGLVFAYVYWKTGSLVPSMTAHLLNNALALILLYFFHQF